jgi:hypothetical protein
MIEILLALPKEEEKPLLAPLILVSFDPNNFLQEETGRFWDGMAFFFKQCFLARESEIFKHLLLTY